MEKQIAGMQANGIHGAFSVTNNLVVEEKEKKDDKKSNRFLSPWSGRVLFARAGTGASPVQA